MDLIDADVVDDLISGIKPTDLLITQGDIFIEIGEYEKAIQAFLEALKADPKNRDIYFSRALANFETGNFDAALDDYLMSKKGRGISKSKYEVSKEFSEALITSLASGVGKRSY